MSESSSSEIKPVRICATDAKRIYGLNDVDLSQVACELRRNPHYSSAAPMRLYLIEDVLNIAKHKEERQKYEADHHAEIVAERVAARKQQAQNAKEAAAARVGTIVASITTSVRDESEPWSWPNIPQNVLEHVMIQLANGVEPRAHGIRCFSAVAKDIANLAISCPDFRAVASTGYKALAAKVESLEPGFVRAWDLTNSCHLHTNVDKIIQTLQLDEFVENPMKLTVLQIKALANQLYLPMTGTKAQLIVRIYDELDLGTHSTIMPVTLMLKIKEERLVDAFSFLKCIVKQARVPELHLEAWLYATFEMRSFALCRMSKASFVSALVAKNMTTFEEVHGALRLFMKAKHQQELHLCIRCTQFAAPTCSMGMCGTCCCRDTSTICKRHKRRKGIFQ